MGVDFVEEHYNVSKFEAFGVASFMINPVKVLEDELNHGILHWQMAKKSTINSQSTSAVTI